MPTRSVFSKRYRIRICNRSTRAGIFAPMRSEPMHTRTLWSGAVDNAQLVNVVVNAARFAWPLLRKPRNIDRDALPLMCWNYVRECTTYQAERGIQTVRMPWAFVALGVGDCKTTAVFIASLCRAAGLPTKVRFVSTTDSQQYGHVFAVIRGVPVDPLLEFGTAPQSLRSQDATI